MYYVVSSLYHVYNTMCYHRSWWNTIRENDISWKLFTKYTRNSFEVILLLCKIDPKIDFFTIGDESQFIFFFFFIFFLLYLWSDNLNESWLILPRVIKRHLYTQIIQTDDCFSENLRRNFKDFFPCIWVF